MRACSRVRRVETRDACSISRATKITHLLTDVSQITVSKQKTFSQQTMHPLCMQQLNATAILPWLGDAYGGCMVDLLDVLHSIVAAVRALGIAGSQYVLEVAAGFLAVVLLCMRIYKYGRDHILKRSVGSCLARKAFGIAPQSATSLATSSPARGIPVHRRQLQRWRRQVHDGRKPGGIL